MLVLFAEVLYVDLLHCVHMFPPSVMDKLHTASQ